MSVTFGSGQTNGLPLLITAITQGARQTLHTFPAGSATPEIVKLLVLNVGAAPATIFVALEDSGATILRLFTVAVPIGGSLFEVLAGNFDGVAQELICNGSATLKVWSDTASVLCAFARVDNQSSAVGTISQNFASGLFASVQNASRFAFPAPGAGVGTATEANANQMIGRAGIIRNLKAKVDSAVANGATLTVAVRVNGASSALTVPIANAQGTTVQSNNVSVALAIGDLVTFLCSCDNAGAPTANVHAAAEYISQ